ncbi:non-ribosomal peptide synthetase [Microbulbifer sp. THAF38]|uniref:non-ribosomal peptide synthetase n=1 Tax=Microbulbifer sp. THAF38 TaxID=2587856 RepID=UPI0012690A69|nr:non-ribosomal peptide synthetase [Microbulbifer sp. THAF38]QFT53934.1 Tyrocidine synthase 3 [Microbulbifer sp. THAF38]
MMSNNINKNSNKKAQLKQQLANLSSEQRLLLQKKLAARNAEKNKLSCLHQRFEITVQQYADKQALVFNDEALTYSEVNAQANEVAHYLIDQGVKQNSVVGICLEDNEQAFLQFVIAMLGISKAGGSWLVMDPEWDEDRIDRIIADSGLSLLLTQSELLSEEAFETLKLIPMDTDIRRRILNRYSQENVDSVSLKHHIEQQLYLDYSDVNKEGVMISHGNLLSIIDDKQLFDINHQSVVAQLNHPCLAANVVETFAALINGAKLIKCNSNIGQIPAQIKEFGIDCLLIKAWVFEQLINVEPDAFSDVRSVIVSGHLSTLTTEKLSEKNKPTSLIVVNGPIESCGISMLATLADNNIPTMGVGIQSIQTFILDEYGYATPKGAVGELHISGSSVSSGYWQNQVKTTAHFIKNTIVAHDNQTLFKTGTLVRQSVDGTLEFIGNCADQVTIGGLTFNLNEVDEVLRQHADIAVAKAVMWQGEKLAAFLVTKQDIDNEQAFTNDLNRWLKGRLEKAMMPVGYNLMADLPLDINNEVSLDKLPEPNWFNEFEYVAPETELEIKVASMWERLLDVEQVGLKDNFFNLGGNSLTAVRLEVEIMEQFNVKVTILELFEAADVASQVKLIEAGQKQNIVPKILPVSREGAQLPLSFAQQRLWFINELEGAGDQYNMPLGLKLSGQLNITALKKSLSDIVMRHEVLRTVYLTNESGIAYQQLLDNVTGLELVEVDFSAYAEDQIPLLVKDYCAVEASKPFDLQNDLMIRACLLKVGHNEHTLLITMHHIATDGWSLGVFIHELGAMYNANVDGRPNLLNPLAIQYADFASWQREWEGSEMLSRQMSFWNKRLENLPQLHSLPLDKVRPEVQTFEGAVHCRQINKRLNEQLNQLSLANDCTLFMTLQTAFALLVSRYSNEQDVVMGTPVANRTQAELSSLIGFFVNTLVLRTDFSDDLSFVDVLKQSKQSILEAFDNQHVPFEMLVEQHQPVRNFSHSPLFQIAFILQNNEMEELQLPGLNITPIDQEHSVAKYDLSLSMQETELGLTASWEYNTDLFEKSTIERMAESFEILISAIVTSPGAQTKNLPLLSAIDLESAALQRRGKELDYDKSLCLHQVFENQVKKSPEHIAVVFDEQSLTYGELNEKANQLARYLLDQGITAEKPVGICLERSVGTMVAILATLKAGGAYLPLDPNYPDSRIQHMLNDSNTAFVITTTEQAKRAVFESQKIVNVDEVALYHDYCVTDLANVKVTPSNLAYIIYTSGSTGVPKGVMLEHEGAVNLSKDQQVRFGVGNESRVLQFASLSFDAATWEWVMALLNGAQLHICSDLQKQTPVLLQDFMVESKITHATLPPALLPHMQAHAPFSLKSLIVAGEACDEQLAYLWALQYSMFNAYGPTESTVCASVAPITLDKPINIGCAISNTNLYILDSEQRPVPQGVIGELYVAGVNVARGYINRPELSDVKFIADPFEHDKRCYRTGDLVRVNSHGDIVFIGRADDQIKLRGFRIEPSEIMSVINTHSFICESFVTVKDIGNESQLVAYLVAGNHTESEQSIVQAVRKWLSERMPEHMHPSNFIVLDTMPLTINGKVNLKALPSPEHKSFDDYVAPANDIEHKLSSIWSALLSIDNVSTNKSFFELGGHSLLVTRLVSAIREAFSVNIEVRQIFDNQTISMQAALISSSDDVCHNAITAVTRDQQLSLSFAQQRLWFVDKLASSTHYNMPIVLAFEGDLDQASFEKALSTIIARHEVLRTNFVEKAGVAYQVIRDAKDFTLEQESLTELSSSEQQRFVTNLVAEEYEHAFDLTQDLMLRARLLTLSEQEYLLLVTTHHIAFDGWSMGIFTHELNTLYKAYAEGENNPLTIPDIQYADFSQWQRNYLQGDTLERQLSYWKQQLDGINPVHSFPLDKARPEAQSFEGATYVNHFNADLTNKIRSLCHDNDVTLFMFLQTAFSVLIARYSGDYDVVMGTPISGRAHHEVESLIGIFLNNLVLRTHFERNASFEEALTLNKLNILDAFSHQDVPFELLVDELKPGRAFNHNALYQIVFALQNFEQGELELTGLTFKPYQLKESVVNVDYELGLHVTELEDQLMLEWTCNTSVFLPQTMSLLASSLHHLVDAIVEDPQQNIHALPVLTPNQLKTLLVDWNDVQREYPVQKGIHQLFEQQAEQNCHKTALHFDGQSLTYQSLNQQANQIANYLVEQGVEKGDLVGLCLEPSIDLVVGMLAILKAGAAYVPLDPSLPEDRVAYILADSQLKWIISQQEQIEDMPFEELSVLPIDAPIWQRLRSRYSDQNPTVFLSDSCKNALAYVIYTSGSTGQPKGVMVEHHNVVGLARDQHYVEIVKEDVIAHAAPPAFDAATFEIWAALCNGASVAYIDKHTLLNPDALEQKIINESVSVMFLTTAVVNQVAYERPSLFGNLRCLLFGGEQVNYEAVQQIIDNGKPDHLLHVYGPTETTTFATYAELTGNYKEDELLISIGGPLSNVEIHVFDEHGQLAAMGAVGELYIGGRGVARGYLNQKALTEERFVSMPLPGRAKQRLYRTGDLVRWLPSGELEFIGRVDHQVKIRGFRIELGEIEHQLTCFPNVKESVVVVRHNNIEGTSDTKQLVAYVAGQGLTDSDEKQTQVVADLRQFLQGKLPEHMVPAIYVILDAMPLTNNGKIDRNALPEPTLTTIDKANYIAPTSETEKNMCAIWQESLGIDKIGVKDNFFNLGGDSILSIRVVSKMNELLGQDNAISIKDIFKYQTVEELSMRIDDGGNEQSFSLQVAPFSQLTDSETSLLAEDIALYDDVYPMSELQIGMVFHSLLQSSGEDYHNIFSIQVTTQWDESCFFAAMSYMFACHPVLRTGFELEGERPLQKIYKSVVLPFTFKDISHLDESAQNKCIVDWIEEEKNNPFNWSGPLFKVFVHKRSNQSIEFGLKFHHAVIDGWSDSMFVSQLFIHYQTLLAGGSLPEAKQEFVFRDFVAQETAILKDANAQQYWQLMLDDAPMQQISCRPKNKHNQESRSKVEYSVDAVFDLSGNLLQLAKDQGVPTQSVLLAAHSKVLSLLSGQSKALTSMVINGRPEYEGGDKGIGLFLNSIPMSFELNECSWADLIHSVTKRITDSMNYRHYPSSAIQRETGRSFSEVVFNYTHFHAYEHLAEQSELAFSNAQGFGQTNFDFTVNFSRAIGEDKIKLTITYDQDMYDAKLIEQIGAYFVNVFNAMLVDIEQSHFTADLLTHRQQEILLTQYNATTESYINDCGIHQLFEEKVLSQPEAIALVFEQQQLTYEELNHKANQFAHYLFSQGVKENSLVALCMTRSVEMFVSILAILKAGSAYLPINMDSPQEHINYVLEDSNAHWIITESALTSGFNTQANLLSIDDEDIKQAINACPKTNVDTADIANHLAYVVYTSGSTGLPKGVMIEHHSLCNLASYLVKELDINAQSRVLQFASIAFDASIFEWSMALCGGAALHVAQSATTKSLLQFEQMVSDRELTHMILTPALLPQLNVERFNSVSHMIVGGEACSRETAQIWSRNRKFYNAYGPTESTVMASIGSFEFDQTKLHIGKPIDNTQLYVVNQGMQLLPPGTVGELVIGGVGLARGYLNRESLTNDKFVTRSFLDDTHTRLYKTGDMVKWLPDGNLEYIGRSDNQIKLRGFRVELGEIEHVLRECHELKDAVVVASGESIDKQLIAYLVHNEDCSVEHKQQLVTQYRQYLQSKLPAFMVPAAFVWLDALPLTISGKTDFNALPDADMSSLTIGRYVAPENDIERQLAEIWQSLLGQEQISVDARFFLIGGHSLLAMKLASKIKANFGVELPLFQLMQAQTIRAQAHLISLGDEGEASDTLVEIQRGDDNSAKPVMYMVPGFAGYSHIFTELAAQLGEEQRVFAFNPSGLDGKSVIHESVESAAQSNVQRLLANQQEGPYVLLGYSMGAAVAFEMVKQLQTIHKLSAHLIVLDGYAQYDGVEQHIFSKLDKSIEQNVEDTGWTAGMAAVVKAQAKWSYKSSPYTLENLLVIQSEDCDINLSEQWQPFVNQCVDYHVVGGGHQTILQMPFVEDISRKIISHQERAMLVEKSAELV